MNEQLYERISKPFRSSKRRAGMLVFVNRLLTLAVYAAYPVALAAAYSHSIRHFCTALFVPGTMFILLSAFRSWYHAPRPYEILDIDPIIKKDTKGKSFPSRHVFSAFMIDMVIFSLSRPFGVLYLLISVMIAAIRVVGGVHFPKDVCAGAVCGVCGWLIGSAITAFLF